MSNCDKEDGMSEASKWICEYCTYENYPSALKCTMCRGAKPLLGENIFRLREESSSEVVEEGNLLILNRYIFFTFALEKWHRLIFNYIHFFAHT